jgi:hypothetical protein
MIRLKLICRHNKGIPLVAIMAVCNYKRNEEDKVMIQNACRSIQTMTMQSVTNHRWRFSKRIIGHDKLSFLNYVGACFTILCFLLM